eukprot:UN12332
MMPGRGPRNRTRSRLRKVFLAPKSIFHFGLVFRGRSRFSISGKLMLF